MSDRTNQQEKPGPTKAVTAWLLRALPLLFKILRAIWPIPRIGRWVAVTRHDHVREVFLDDETFPVAYGPKLDVITGGEPFILGIKDTPDYHGNVAALRSVIRAEDIGLRLVPATERAVERVLAARTDCTVEVVDALVRAVTFEVIANYLGITDPSDGDLRDWCTCLFKFQFADQGNDPVLRAEVDRTAPALRRHIDGLIRARKATASPEDDVLGRCLAARDPRMSDTWIRTNLLGMVVGGPPQPPMVVPQALEQLLRRPAALAGAQKAAREGDDTLLSGYVLEAMRFDPLAPGLFRVADRNCVLADGTPHARAVPAGATIFVAFSSAMMDERRVSRPGTFDPRRPPHEYIHFGHGLHTCFGERLNNAMLPALLKPLLKRPGLARVKGTDGQLRKRGAFAERLVVQWQESARVC